MTREYERVVCPCCGRKISAWVPHFGDGSDVKLVKHSLVDPSKTRARSVECAGSNKMLGELKGVTR